MHVHVYLGRDSGSRVVLTPQSCSSSWTRRRSASVWLELETRILEFRVVDSDELFVFVFVFVARGRVGRRHLLVIEIF